MAAKDDYDDELLTGVRTRAVADALLLTVVSAFLFGGLRLGR